jgi:hypothetical protein
LSYYFVGARGRQVYLSYTALLSSLLSPRSPHLNIAALSERFIALRSPLAEGIGRDATSRRRRREPDRCRSLLYARARARARSEDHGSTRPTLLRLLHDSLRPPVCSFHVRRPYPSSSSSCPAANYNVRFREFLPLYRAAWRDQRRIRRIGRRSRRTRCNDKASSRPPLQGIVVRKRKRKETAEVICILRSGLLPSVSVVLSLLFLLAFSA